MFEGARYVDFALRLLAVHFAFYISLQKKSGVVRFGDFALTNELSEACFAFCLITQQKKYSRVRIWMARLYRLFLPSHDQGIFVEKTQLFD